MAWAVSNLGASKTTNMRMLHAGGKAQQQGGFQKLLFLDLPFIWPHIHFKGALEREPRTFLATSPVKVGLRGNYQEFGTAWTFFGSSLPIGSPGSRGLDRDMNQGFYYQALVSKQFSS